MIIQDDRVLGAAINLAELAQGQVFYRRDSTLDLYIRGQHVEGSIIVVTRLSDGVTVNLEASTKIVPVNAKVVMS